MKIFEENIRVVHIPQRSIFPQITLQPGLCRTFSETTLLRPYQGFWGFGEKGHLFSGSWGALANILRDLGSKQVFGEQKKKTFRELGKNKSGSWGEGSFFFREQGAKIPPLVGPHCWSVSHEAGLSTRGNRKIKVL